MTHHGMTTHVRQVESESMCLAGNCHRRPNSDLKLTGHSPGHVSLAPLECFFFSVLYSKTSSLERLVCMGWPHKLEVVPDGIVCFFTSYRYLEQAITPLRDEEMPYLLVTLACASTCLFSMTTSDGHSPTHFCWPRFDVCVQVVEKWYETGVIAKLLQHKLVFIETKDIAVLGIIYVEDVVY
eukprot:4741970-Amphidinium_carterae.1